MLPVECSCEMMSSSRMEMQTLPMRLNALMVGRSSAEGDENGMAGMNGGK